MSEIRRQGWSPTVALLAAYLLVVQSLLSAFSIGASASPAQLDFFGNVICTSKGAVTFPGGNDPADRHDMPYCCFFGCSIISPMVVSPPEFFGIVTSPLCQAVAFIFRGDEKAVVADEGKPSNPRAPPLNA